MSLPSLKTDDCYTYADYMKWPENERWELIEGVPCDMSPAPSTKHQQVVLELATQIHGRLAGKECEAFIAPFDVRLAETDEADEAIANVVQPDISVICDPSKIDDRGCRGAPDWIIEVLSPHTSSKDHIQKRNLYEKHGVREYWLVHPLDRLITVFVLGNDGKFGPPSFHEGKGGVQPNILPELTIDLDGVF